MVQTLYLWVGNGREHGQVGLHKEDLFIVSFLSRVVVFGHGYVCGIPITRQHDLLAVEYQKTKQNRSFN